MFDLACSCGARLRASDDQSDQPVRCPKCRAVLIAAKTPAVVPADAAYAFRETVQGEPSRMRADAADAWHEQHAPVNVDLQHAPVSQKAIASLVCGLLSFFPLIIPNF